MKEENKKLIEFTPKQFLTLMKAVYLGNWMANANRDGSLEVPHKKEYEDIESYIFSLARQFNFGEYVDDEDAERYGRVFPTRKFEEGTDVNQLHDEYDEETFWDEIIDRLGNRDFYRQYSEKEIKKMSRDERFQKLYECEDKWADEISENGVERLKFNKK